MKRDVFKSSFATALLRRLHPNTGLHRKQLASAIGVHENTIDNWCTGYSFPDGYLMGELISLFDASFANEVYAGHGALIAKIDDARRAAAIQAVNKLSPALEALAEMVAA